MTSNKGPLKVGLTGGIGAGKSVVAKVFAVLGVPVYEADDRAKYLLTHDTVLKQSVTDAFGKDAYLENGEPNRPYLAEKVFGDEERLAVLNGLVHPRIGEDFAEWHMANEGAPYVLKVAALLFESGSYHQLDKIITVSASEKERVERTLMRDQHRSQAQIRSIIERQMPAQEKELQSNFVIKNDKGDAVIPQVLDLHKKLLTLSEKR
ncbi:dephospho-CoA kinase [Roseivirga sp. BDSF3-8]|uniref:dephospho-CoA kinase n=1 Tax=Roseivirga sp. BDSF3-8 TaxID=3241598 RepID=UPI0035319212